MLTEGMGNCSERETVVCWSCGRAQGQCSVVRWSSGQEKGESVVGLGRFRGPAEYRDVCEGGERWCWWIVGIDWGTDDIV